MELNIKLARPVTAPVQVYTPPPVPLRDQVWEIEETQVIKRQISLPMLQAQLASGQEQIKQYQAQIVMTQEANDKLQVQIDELTAHIAQVQSDQDAQAAGVAVAEPAQ